MPSQLCFNDDLLKAEYGASVPVGASVKMPILQIVPDWKKGIARDIERMMFPLCQQALPNSIGGGSRTVRGIGFIEDIGHMRGDSSGTDEQRVSDVLVALSLGNETEHLHFAPCETIRVSQCRLW